MRISRQLSRLEPMVLKPLHRLTGDDWHRAPTGKWSIAQLVQHLAIGVDSVAEALGRRADRTGMKRRASPHQTVLRHLALGFGRFSPGIESPKGTRPDDRPDPELICAQFRMGVERLREIAEDWPRERQQAVFVNHPILGDLNFPEWVRFHFVHCRHHGRQIRSRLEWIERQM
jgi:hypothetical protein